MRAALVGCSVRAAVGRAGALLISRGLLCAVLVGGWTGAAAAWGEQGHRAIAQVAGTLLAPGPRAAVVKLLGNDDLAAASVWLDDVRMAALGRGPLVGDAEAEAFNRRHPDSGSWHFVNLPLGARGYRPDPQFAPPGNVVDRIGECIRILEAPSGATVPMSRAHALKALIHLVGDLHQPLHVGSGYYQFEPDDRAVLVRDPARARGRPSDRGGNLLRWGGEPGESLHVDWDVTIVRRIADGPSPGALAAVLATEAAGVSRRTRGDYRTAWARRWAAEALRQANRAYDDIAFARAVRDPQYRLEFIAIGFVPDRDTYLAKNTPVATAQLAKAAVRLAALLNRIAWP